jgi:hypothetical protein
MSPRCTAYYADGSIGNVEEDRKKPNDICSSIGGVSSIPLSMKSRWRYLLGLLSRTSVRGNVQPQIGQLCIIMTGVAGQDEGQMGIVTSQTRVMVEVTLASKSGEGIITKTKQPRSLVLLEAGLVMVQDPDGSVWVRSSQGQGIKRTDSGDSRHGAVE